VAGGFAGVAPGAGFALLAGLGTVPGLAAAGAFVAWAQRAPAPLVDLALFRHRTYRFANAATLSFGTAFSMMFLTFFFYMMNVWHFSLPEAGLAVTPGPLLVIPTAIVTGRLATRLGHRPFLVGGSLLYACSSVWFLLVPGTEVHYLSHWLPGLVMSGIAVGLVLPSLSAAAVSRLPVPHYAVGSAVNVERAARETERRYTKLSFGERLKMQLENLTTGSKA
jgi:predicted MFS family arabinose efflux permease